MIAELDLRWIVMPMPRAFGHARSARSVAESIVLHLQLDGYEGAGECVPREYVTGETPTTAFDALERLDVAALDRLIDRSSFEAAVRSIEKLRLHDRLRTAERSGNAAACAIELALLDAVGKRFQRPLRDLASVLGLPESLRRPPDAVHSASGVLDFTRTPDEFVAIFNGAIPRHIKSKVGADLDGDVVRTRRLRELVGANTVLSVDANMEWTLESATLAIDRLTPFGISWYEEPLAQRALVSYRALREATGAKIMLDESLCSFEDGLAAVEGRSCDLFNIRISKCGGMLPSLRLAELAHAHGLGFQLGVQVGQMAILAAASRQFVSAVGPVVAYEGAAVMPFSEHIVREKVEFDRSTNTCGHLPGVGLGVTLDHKMLERATQRRARWSAQQSAWRS